MIFIFAIIFHSHLTLTASDEISNRVDLDTRITGGDVTDIYYLPYQVALLSLIRRGRAFEFSGGGSIISHNFVLTAGELNLCISLKFINTNTRRVIR